MVLHARRGMDQRAAIFQDSITNLGAAWPALLESAVGHLRALLQIVSLGCSGPRAMATLNDTQRLSFFLSWYQLAQLSP